MRRAEESASEGVVGWWRYMAEQRPVMREWSWMKRQESVLGGQREEWQLWTDEMDTAEVIRNLFLLPGGAGDVGRVGGSEVVEEPG